MDRSTAPSSDHSANDGPNRTGKTSPIDVPTLPGMPSQCHDIFVTVSDGASGGAPGGDAPDASGATARVPADTARRVSLAVLVGGAGTRMGHVNKALLDLGGERVLDRLLRRAEPLFAETLLVARDPAPFAAYAGPRRRVVSDLFEARSSLTGIHAALSAARTDHVFVTACDTPLVSPAVIRLLLERLTPETDVLAPQWEDGYYEPLCAVYSRRCLPFAEELLRADRFQIVRFFDRVRTETLPMDAVRAADPRLLTFANANTPDELEALRRLAANPEDPTCPVPGRP